MTTSPSINLIDWKKVALRTDATVREAAEILEYQSFHIALVADQSGRLLGTVSDGDIRRGLLSGQTLDSVITSIMHRRPTTALFSAAQREVLDLMNRNKISQVPVVYEDGRLSGLYIRGQLNEQPALPNTVVIMAGGMGTRLRPHTEACPKPMLELAGKPMLEHIIESAKSEGFSNFVVTLNYLGYMIEDHFGDGSGHGVSILYTKEEKALGTAGALSLLQLESQHPFIVTNGDIISDVRLSAVLDFHEYYCADATMGVRRYEWQNPFGVVHVEGMDITGFQEKPVVVSNINAGVYALNSVACNFAKSREFYTMPELFEDMRKDGFKTIACPLHETWLDVGRPADYQKAIKMKSRG